VRKYTFFYTLALMTIVVAMAVSCAKNQPDKSAENASFANIPPPASTSMAGGYLAGRFAQRQQDWDAAQGYMSTVLDHDRSNEMLAQRTFLLALGSGNFIKAKELAAQISGTAEGSELALIFLSCDAISRDDFTAALRYLGKLPTEGFGQYTKPLLTAWSLAGLGKKAAALKLLAANSAADDPTYRIHAGLMEELAGNMNAAAAHYKVAMENGLDLHTAVIVGNFFERYGQPEISRGIYRDLGEAYPFNPFVSALSGRDPHRVISPNIARAADGASLALLDLATLLYDKRAYDSAQIYSGMVQMLDPQSAYAKMMMGDIASLHGQYGKAVGYYNSIDRSEPISYLSRIRVTEVYEASGEIEKSIKTLTDMAKESVIRVAALVSLGDTYRRHEQFENAIDAYDQALADIAPLTPDHWPIIYARGIAEAQLNRWSLAEKDLLQALAFQPKNPMILNFIAYSWADKGVNLDKALEYAKDAAALRPDDGYILDSYGWTLFRLARYQESIVWLELAVEQVPGDSTLLDHLGDAYWQTGRKNEAQYQWRHANDLSQDPLFKQVVEQKMKHGIVVPSQVARKEAKL
jgi:Flp pilus assembly protein TadD